MLQRINSLVNHHYKWALILGLVYFLLNLTQTSPVNVGYADSDELLTVAYHLGIAHPPGYPLYILLLHWFMKLPFPAFSLAYKGHVLSSIFASITIALVYLCCIKLYGLLKPPKLYIKPVISIPIERWFLAITASLTLAFTFQFWLYAHITEIFSLATVFVAAFMLTGLYIIQSPKPHFSHYVLLGAILGLGIAHLQSIALLLPSAIYLIWLKHKQRLLPCGAAFALPAITAFLLTYLLTIQFSLNQPLISWQFTPDGNGIIRLISRADFAGLRYASGRQVGAYLDNLDINKFSHASLFYLVQIIRQVGWWTVILLALAITFGSKRLKSSFWFIALASGLLGWLFVGYLGMPEDWGSQGVTLRQYIPGFIPLTLLLYLGWYELLKRLNTSLRLIFPNRYLTIGLGLLPLFLLFTHARQLYPLADLSFYTQISQRYRHMLTQFAPGSLVTCYSDTACFALLYEKYVNNSRPDIDIIPMAYPLLRPLVDSQDIRNFPQTYTDNPYLTLDAITANVGKRPVYAVELSPVYANLLGLNGPFMYYLPRGTYGELLFDLPNQYIEPIIQDNDTWLSIPTSTLDPMRIFHKSILARDYLLHGSFYLKMGHREWALAEFNRASNIFFSFSQKDKDEFTALRNQLEQTQAEANFAAGSSIPSSSELLSYVSKFMDQNQLNRAFTYAHAAMARDPNNIDARIWLAKIYLAYGDLDFAKKEIQNALLIDKQNPQALETLKQIDPNTAL